MLTLYNHCDINYLILPQKLRLIILYCHYNALHIEMEYLYKVLLSL